MSRWVALIGMEVHAQINSKSKLFSAAENKFMAAPNSLVAPFDAALPGTLPVLNKGCVEAAVATGLALNCNIALKSYFDRKHYFYADMPQGYQITQQRYPIATNGCLKFPSIDGKSMKHARIQQIQLEQDSGKSMHDQVDNLSVIDLNRAGVGLMELVTAPDFHNADDSSSFVKELILTLEQIGSCQCKAEEGEIRVDANVSVSRSRNSPGTRAEVKNISGISALRQAIEYEIARQVKVLEQGGTVVQETRTFDDDTGETRPMRDKESAADYRFMPEPNLPPLVLYNDHTVSLATADDPINVDEVRRKLPMLPSEMRHRLQQIHELSTQQATFLMERGMAEYGLAVMAACPTLVPSLVFEWMRQHVVKHLNDRNIPIKDCAIEPDQLGELLVLEQQLSINQATAVKAFNLAAEENKTPCQVVEERDWLKVADSAVMREWCALALRQLRDEQPSLFLFRAKKATAKKREKWRRLVVGSVSARVGEVSGGKAHMKVARSTIERLLGDDNS